MNGVKILHTADCHLGSSRVALGGMHMNGRQELCAAFFRIIRICRDENIDFLLIAGDLFEMPFVSESLAKDIIDSFSQIPDTKVIIATGNHDAALSGSVYSRRDFPKNVTLFTGDAELCDFPEKNVCIYGAGFSAKSEKRSLIDDFPAPKNDRINIGVLHADLTASSQDSSYNPITTAQIAASGLDYLALGHIHKRTPIEKAGSVYYSYCGCPDGRGFDEDGSCGVYIGTVGKGFQKLEFRKLSSRVYLSFSADITGAVSSSDAADKIEAVLRKNYGEPSEHKLFKITLIGSISTDVFLNPERIRMILEERSIFCTVADKTAAALDSIEKIAAEHGLRGAFADKMLKKIQNAPEDEKEFLQTALQLGLKAFDCEVGLYDN